MNVRWLDALMVLVRISSTSRFTLRKLRIQSSWLVGLVDSHTFDRFTTLVPFRIISLNRPPRRVQYNFLALSLIVWWLHGVHSYCIMLGTDLTSNHLLLLHIWLDRWWLLSLETLLSATLKVLADMKGRCSETVPVLTFSCRFLAWTLSRWLDKCLSKQSMWCNHIISAIHFIASG